MIDYRERRNLMYYTVTQVSEMFNVNPETVRRWCRTGQLSATLECKKSGFHIDEKSLNDFANRYNKYGKMVLPTEAISIKDNLKEIQTRLNKIKRYTKRIDELVEEIEELM